MMDWPLSLSLSDRMTPSLLHVRSDLGQPLLYGQNSSTLWPQLLAANCCSSSTGFLKLGVPSGLILVHFKMKIDVLYSNWCYLLSPFFLTQYSWSSSRPSISPESSVVILAPSIISQRSNIHNILFITLSGSKQLFSATMNGCIFLPQTKQKRLQTFKFVFHNIFNIWLGKYRV